MADTDYNFKNTVGTRQGDDVSSAIRARKAAYQEYMTEGAPSVLSDPADIAALNLEYDTYKQSKRRKGIVSGDGTFTPEDNEPVEDDVFEKDDTRVFQTIKDGVNSFMIDMNTTQISSANGQLIRTILPELEKLEGVKSSFDKYNEVSSKIAEYENQEGFKVTSLLPRDYFLLKREESELSEQLRSLGVAPNGSNFKVMYDANEKAISDLRTKEKKLRESIAEDENDLDRYSVSAEYQEKKETAKDLTWDNWQYRLPGVLGSSASSFVWQVAPYATTILKSQLKKGLVKMGATTAAGSVAPGVGNAAGAIAGAVLTAADVANGVFMVYSNYQQSKNEADAEVYDNYKQRVRGTLEQNGVSSEAVVDAVRNNPEIADRYKDYTADQVFDKVLNGEIKLPDQGLNDAMKLARSGTDQVYKQNLAITFGTNVISDLIYIPYVGDILGKGAANTTAKYGKYILDPVMAAGADVTEYAEKQLYKHILKRNVLAGATSAAKQKVADAAKLGIVLAGKQIVQAIDESIQEGSQYTTGQKYISGEYDNVHEDNLMGEIKTWGDAIAGSFIERAGTTANVLGALVGYKNPLLESDTEYWDNVKLGAAASLFSPMSAGQTAIATYSSAQKMSAYNSLARLATKEVVAKDNIAKAVTFVNAQYKGKEGFVIEGLEAIKNDPTLLPDGVTPADIDKQIKFANNVYSYAKSDAAKSLAKTLNIKEGSTEYGQFVGLAMQSKDDHDRSLLHLSEATRDSEMAYSKLIRDVNDNDLISESISNAVKRHNDAQTDPDKLITTEEFSKLMMDNNNIATLERVLEVAKSTKGKHRGFSDVEIDDFVFRTEQRLTEMKEALPSWYTKDSEDSFKGIMMDAETILGGDIFKDALEKKESAYIQSMIYERNRELMRAFYNMDAKSATSTELLLLKSARKNRTKKRRRSLYEKEISRKFTIQGKELVADIYDRFVNARETSAEDLAIVTGADEIIVPPITPIKPIVTADPVVDEETAPIVPTKKGEVIPELADAEALLALAEKQQAPPVTPQTPDSSKEEDPFAGMESDIPTPEPGKKTKKKAEPGKKREPKKREPKKKTTPEVAEQVQTPAPIIEEEQAPIVDEETRLRDEVANEGAKLAELLAKKFRGKANLGIINDPMDDAQLDVDIMIAGVNMMKALFKLGSYKFKDFIKSFYQVVGEDAAIVSNYFDNLKGIYFYKYANSTAAEKAEMDSIVALENMTAASVIDQILNEDTGDAITIPPVVEENKSTVTGEQLREFTESSELGILNTFHYNPNGTTPSRMNIDGKVYDISAPSELAPLLTESPDEFSYELKVLSSKSKPTVWGDPNIQPSSAYDNAMIGVLATHSNGKRFWLSLKTPSGLESLLRDPNSGVIDQQELFQKKESLRKVRHDIVKLFVKDGAIRTDIKVVPSHVLLHNGLATTYRQTSINDPQYKDIFKFDSDLANEADNFAFSGGARSDTSSGWRTLSGNALPYALSSSGGIYYVISGNKRLSGYELPLHIRTASYKDSESIANLLVDLLFKYGINDDVHKVNDTDLTVSDVFALLWHTGLSTSVNANDTRLSPELRSALNRKKIYISKGMLYLGENQPMSINDPNAKALAANHIQKNGAIPFQTGEDSASNVNKPLREIFSGRLAASIEKAGGKLTIAEGVEFTTDDLNGTLLTWMIKTGKLTTDLNAIKYNRPFVIVDSFSVEQSATPKVEVAVAPSPAPVPAEPKKRGNGPSLASRGSMFGIDTDGISIVEMTPSNKMKDRVPAKLDREKAVLFLKDVMGLSDEEFTIVDIANSSEKPLQAVSYMSSDSITLMSSDPFGTEYHEAWHRVSLLLMPIAQKQRVYAEFRRTNKEYANASDKIVEEALAEDFRYFVTVRIPSKSYVITKWFDKLKSVFLRLTNREDIGKIRRDIIAGKYRNVPVNQDAKSRFIKVYGDRANFTQHGLEFKSLTLDSYFSAIKYLSSVAVIKATGSNVSEIADISKYELALDDLKSELEFVRDAGDATDKHIEVATELLNNFEAIKRDIVEELRGNAFNVDLEEMKQEEIDARSTGESDPNDLDAHTKLAFQSSKLDYIRPAVKMFLTSIIDTIRVNGRDIPKINQETGMFEMVSLTEAWNKIVKKLGTAKTYKELVEGAKLLAKHDNFFNMLYFKLSKIKDPVLQTQIFQEISSFTHDFLTVGIGERTEGETSYQYITLDGSSSKRNLKNEISKWNVGFIDAGLTSIVDGEVVVNTERTTPILERFNSLTKAINALDDYNFQMEAYNSALAELTSILNSMGLSTDIATINQVVINNLLKLQARVGTQALGNASLKPTYVMALKALVTNRNTGIDKAITGILKGSSETDKYKKNGNEVFNNEPKLTPIAEISYVNRSKDAEERVVGPKNTTLYPVSKHNYLTLEIDRLNGDRAYVNSLLSVPINASSIILNALKSKLNLKLKAKTVINFVEFESGNSGKDFQSTTFAESFALKLALIENDILLLPTMSDKGTYQPIEGITLFDGKFLDSTMTDGTISQTIPQVILDQFSKYYISEYNAILQYRRLKQMEEDGTKIPGKNRIVRYFGEEGKEGNGGKFRMTRGFYRRTSDGSIKYTSFDDMTDVELAKYFKNTTQMNSDIHTMLEVKINEELDYIKDLGIVSEKDGKLQWFNNFDYVGSRIAKLKEKNGGRAAISEETYTNAAIMDLIAKFTISHYVSMFEAEKVLFKDIAYYKSYTDVAKRLAGVLSTGGIPRVDFEPGHWFYTEGLERYTQGKYNVGAMADIKIRTNQPVALYNAIYRAYIAEGLVDYKDVNNDRVYSSEDIDEILNSSDDLFGSDRIPKDIQAKAKASTEHDIQLYGDITRNDDGGFTFGKDTPINQADATVYCTPTMYKAILETHGDLTPEIAAAIDYLEENSDNIGNPEVYAKTLAAVMHPLKMVYFGNDVVEVIPGSGEYINAPIFNKMAIFPLFKVLANADLKPLYDRMSGKMSDGTVGSPIDMVTTYQGVKVGNVYEPEYYTDGTQTEINIKGIDNMIIRSQSFMNLLEQMPIEPHKDERRMLVSQALKTVFSNIRHDSNYTLPMSTNVGGRIVTGKELGQLAMSAIKELSNRGSAKIKKTLGIVDTNNGFTFENLKGLSDELVRACKSSGFSSDMLYQLMLNPKGQFNVPLSASISEKRLFSKLMSQVNKKAIDMNLPGGTYVQMTSFGVKSINKLSLEEIQSKVKYTVNNGNRLEILRSDNSMEAVISLNAFMHILPKEVKSDFMLARKWLLDNNIIGSSASPAAMGYRVPTQGMSSIAALTIMDVLPPQIGDVIILPDDFTARTGADFDIDKLFLTRYNYEDGSKVQYDYEKTIEENSTKAVENLLVDTFMATLTDQKNAHDTLRPIDAPISELKDIQQTYHKDKVNKEALSEYSHMYQDKLKQEFADSKTGIGPYALNLPNHVLTQMAGLKMNLPAIYEGLGDFSKITGIDGIHILDWLSALVSAHVDVAKDSYIIKLNVNKYTYNMSNFLLRSGIGKNTFFFLSQEILKRVADAYNQSRSTYGPNTDKPAYKRFSEDLINIEKEFKDKAMAIAKEERDAKNTDASKELFTSRVESLNEIAPNTISSRILTDSTLLESLLSDKVNGKVGFDYYLNQLEILQLYKDLSQYADALGDLVHASQIDTKKFGKTPIELRSFNDDYNGMLSSMYFDTEDIERYFNSTFLEQMRSNSVDLILGAFSSQFIASNPAYYQMYKSILKLAGIKSIKDDRTRGQITNAIDSLWRSVALYPSKEGSDSLLSSPEDIQSLFFGRNTMARRLNKLKKDILDAAARGETKYEGITVSDNKIDNLFLNSMSGVTDPSGINAEFISPNYTDIGATNLGRQMREYWQNLLDSPNEEVRLFAEDLVKYAIFNGHGAKHMTSLFDFIPQQKLEEIGYYSRVRDMEKMSERDLFEMLSSNTEELFRNNWYNDRLVPKLYQSKTNKLYTHRVSVRDRVMGSIVVARQAIVAIKGTSLKPIGRTEDNVPMYHPFIKYKNPLASGGFDLYRLAGVYSKLTDNGVVYKPLYILTNKKGVKGMVDKSFKARRVFNGNRSLVTEYTPADYYGEIISAKRSAVPQNNTAPKIPILGKSGKQLYYSTLASDYERALNIPMDQVNYIEDSDQDTMDKFVNLVNNEVQLIGQTTTKSEGWTFSKMNVIDIINGINNDTVKIDGMNVDEDGDMSEITTVGSTATERADKTVNVETTFKESPSSGYQQRTMVNASADATIAIATNFNSAGEILTKNSVQRQRKVYMPIDGNNLDITDERVNTIVNKLNAINKESITLNIAGNGIYTLRGKYTQAEIDEFTYSLLKAVVESPNLKTTISLVRSGGQTGFDEAGVKAGNKLGIPTLVLAPKGWKFRDITGADIQNETMFKSRFGEMIKPSPIDSQTSIDFNNNNEYPDDAMNNCKGK